MNSGVGMSAMSFSLHKGLLIQQLHSIVSPALHMTFPEMREKMEIWDLESGLPGCLHVNKVQSSKSMSCLRPSSSLGSNSMEEMWTEINAGRIPKLTVAVCTWCPEKNHSSTTLNSSNTYTGTWNVNGKILKHQDVSDWLCPPGCKKADIIAVGLQEMVSLNTFNVAVSDGAAGKAAQKWVQVLETRLGSKEYVCCCVMTYVPTH